MAKKLSNQRAFFNSCNKSSVNDGGIMRSEGFFRWYHRNQVSVVVITVYVLSSLRQRSDYAVITSRGSDAANAEEAISH